MTPGTTYHFRLRAWNGESGGEDYSGDATFTTEVAPPLVGAQTVNVGATTAKLAAQIEPEGFETKYHFEYGREAGKYTAATTEETLKEKGTGWESVRAEVSGLEVCQTYHFRVVATNQDGTVDESDQEFKTECLPPEVVTGVASELQPHSATVSGTVNPEGEAGSFQFEYGTSNKFGSLAPEVAGSAGEGRGAAPVSAGLTNLKQHAVYHYRLSASNARGVSKGSEDTFETLYAPPRVCGEKAAESRPESAVLEAEVDPEENATSYYFEYGLTEAYGTRLPLLGESAGSGVSCVKVSDAVVGLVEGQSYYFRVVAENGGKTAAVAGSADEFRTPVDWQMGGREVEAGEPLRSAGTLLLEAPVYGTVRAECSVDEAGEAEADGAGTITSVTGAKGEKAISCGLVNKGECFSSTGEVEAVGLPWRTELVDVPVKNAAGDVERYEVRDRFYNGSGGSIGWMVKCKTGEVTHSDVCTGEFSGNLENVSAGVPVELDAASPRLTCEYKDPGAVTGVLVFSSGVEGEWLSVSGALAGPQRPVVVTGEADASASEARLTGTVAARGAATSYWFEYGQTTGYGVRVPVSSGSAGEARLPVEVSQSVSGLEVGVLYHYRLVASNSGGISYGEDKTVTPGDPSRWHLGSEQKPSALDGAGTLLIEAPAYGKVRAECAVAMTGETPILGALYQYGTITAVTGAKGEKAIPCSLAKKGGCLSSTGELEAVGLPWRTELMDVPVKNAAGEVARYEVRDRFYSSDGENDAGWTLACKNGETTHATTCAGEFSGNLENTPAGVPVELDDSSPPLSCSSGEEPAVLAGAIVFSSGQEGEQLNVTGAPTGPQKPAVATGEAQETTSTTSKLTGTIATRAAATSYHFQYGPTIKYGSSIPGEGKEASAGESRTPLEVSQTISALQPRTLYHYRLVATNSAGTTYGTDKTLITEHPAQWQINAKTIIDAPIQGEGTLTIHDSGLDLTAECALQNTGYVKDSSGEIETLTGSKGETSIDCHPTSSGWCATTQIEITGTQLPWNTELIDQPTENSEGETHYEPRLRLQNTSWTIKCAYMGSTITDTCTGQPTAHTENTPTATLIDFETNTPTLTCTGSTISTGTIQGTLTLKSTETGKTLNIYGAPGET